VSYQLADTLFIDTFPPNTNGYQFTLDSFEPCTKGNGNLSNGNSCEEQKWLVDHDQWLIDHAICQRAASVDADEIWLFSAPFVMTWESFMIGPSMLFGPNGGQYVSEACARHYIVQDCYGPGETTPSLHCYGHRVEATMHYITSSWRADDHDRYWESFAIVSQYNISYDSNSGEYPGKACGNAHWAATSSSHYDYSNTKFKDFNCPDWQNFPHFEGKTVHINCEAWGCSDSGWGQYWLGSLPNRAGSFQMTSALGKEFVIDRNWWKYLVSPGEAKKLQKAGF
jgi:hypothetical protein